MVNAGLANHEAYGSVHKHFTKTGEAVMPPFNMTKAAFLSAVGGAEHGERITYHVGFLLGDRQTGTAWETVQSGQIAMVAMTAMRTAEEGRVKLFQKKLQPGIYQYIAVRCHPPEPIVWEGCYDPERMTYIKPSKPLSAEQQERKNLYRRERRAAARVAA